MNHNNKKSFFNAAKQAGKAHEWAIMRKNLHFKREKSYKQPYKPGKTVLGLSAVSQATLDVDGRISSRRERRKLAKGNYPFTACYNGEGPQRVHHNVRPSKYAGARG